MLKYAITGNIASGKSTVENIISDLGYKVLDTDNLAHKHLNDTEIIQQFKDFDVFENGKILRSKLGKLVFNNPELKTKLENIIHPKIKNEIEEFFTNNITESKVFVSIPLLFEAKMENLFDKIIFIYTDNEIRFKRLIKRNNYTKDYANLRINCQLPQENKIKLADYVIYNNTTIEDLKKEITKLIG